MNKTILSGRLTKDPDIRATQTGKTAANFTLAVNRRFSKNEHPEADFIPCVAWGKTAEIAGNYLRKGSKILVEGRIQVRSYDANDGGRRWVTEIIVDEFEFLEKKQDSGSNAGQFGKTVPDEEIPF